MSAVFCEEDSCSSSFFSICELKSVWIIHFITGETVCRVYRVSIIPLTYRNLGLSLDNTLNNVKRNVSEIRPTAPCVMLSIWVFAPLERNRISENEQRE